MRSLRRYLPVFLLFTTGTPTCGLAQTPSATGETSIFRRPALVEASHELQVRAVFLAQIGQKQMALAACEEAAKIAPFSSVAQYNLGCIHATNGDTE